MNLNKLADRLRRDLARNKAKSAVLGVLCLVALYYWFPLVAKLWSKSSKADPSETAETTVETPAATPVGAAEPDPFHWQEFVAWCKSDPRMTAMTIPSGARNPFQDVISATMAETPENDVAGDDAAANATVVRVTPADMGLQLRGTLIGSRRSTANIGGIAYELGENVEPKSGESPETTTTPQMQFRLVEIGDRHVLLERDGELHRLEMEQSPEVHSGRIEIRPSGNR